MIYYAKLLGMWNDLLSLPPLKSCQCQKGVEQRNLQTYQFLMGLYDDYSTLHTKIINMTPSPIY